MKTIYSCFPGGKHKCLTLSYDDGNIADRRLVSIFNEHGLKGTFHLNSELMQLNSDRWRIPQDEVKSLYAGHEVSCHTATHPSIARCPLPSVALEITKDRIVLESIVGYPVRGMSYPNGSHSKEIRDMLPSLGIEYARTVDETFWFGIPEDLLQWKATCHHNHRLMEMTDLFINQTYKQHLYLFYVWGHSYEFDRDDNWGLIEEFARLAGGRDDIWYATNIEIVDWMNDYTNLRFAADNSFVYNPSSRDVWISVDNEIVRIRGGEQKML